MHSYGSFSVSLSSSQEDEAHIKMSTRKDLFHFLNEGSCVWSEMMGATLDKMVLFSAPVALWYSKVEGERTYIKLSYAVVSVSRHMGIYDKLGLVPNSVTTFINADVAKAKFSSSGCCGDEGPCYFSEVCCLVTVEGDFCLRQYMTPCC